MLKLVFNPETTCQEIETEVREALKAKGIVFESESLRRLCFVVRIGEEEVKGRIDLNSKKDKYRTSRSLPYAITSVTVNCGYQKCKVFSLRKGGMLPTGEIVDHINAYAASEVEGRRRTVEANQRAADNKAAQIQELQPIADLRGDGFGAKEFKQFGLRWGLKDRERFATNNAAEVTRKEDGTYKVMAELTFANAEEVITYLRTIIPLK